MIGLHAQTGPVFLTFRPMKELSDVMKRSRQSTPLYDFAAIDGVRHRIWMLSDNDARDVVNAFTRLDALYIADGHHRAASAARAHRELKSPESAFMLGVAFPSDHVRILPYNRVIRDLDGRSAEEFLGDLARRGFLVTKGEASPAEKGDVSMYVAGTWYHLDLDSGPLGSGGMSPGDRVVESLDGNVLQSKVLEPVLAIGDVRSDPRIEFVGGARGTKTLEELVDSGRAAVAFSMYPVSVYDLMAVSDAGAMMPPKSTWFEPKLRDGLLIHEI